MEFYNLINKIFPKDHLQRRMLSGIWRILRGTYQRLIIFTKIIRTTMRRRRNRFFNRTIIINSKSKKIVYIGHSFHFRTKSDEFLIKYLQEKFEVRIVSDESWLGKTYPDLSFVGKEYLGVLFFQSLPPPAIINKIDNQNKIFIPMYDGVEHSNEFWSSISDFKIINFSSSLHRITSRSGLRSIYIKYFPEPKKFELGNKNEVFFWQRLTKLNIQTIFRLLDDQQFKLHLHNAIDPNHRFTVPTKEDEEKYQISYSTWFDSKENLWNVMAGKSVYVAPREMEGIGMSFLEAMAMGKAVIAVNKPTMNEYIMDRKTGYLFDLAKPSRIDLGNVRDVQVNAYEYIQEGFEEWKSEKDKIVDFIYERRK